ncbi:cysteine proteinase [Malassezia pachydermatis]|uniref:Cysteine proteinase n=1 Tax=Malassezia pachydermatis TaxID=77020 RepID=A0A0M8MMP3_9BASI|nr:cysteine proteinase [Malassezia pachydermatis]KOS13207.1 cysteine proteinase [Malassezia pachydermatis]
MEQLLRRYAAGLRWGQRLLSGKIRPQDGAEEEEERDKKRQKLEYPTCAVCQMDLRRPFVCLTCAYTACLFHDPVREAMLPISMGVQSKADGDEVGTSHMGLHLAEEAHSYACDIVNGTVFCSACDDVVYDPRLEYVLAEEQHRSHVARPNEATLDAVQALDATSTQGVTLPGICRVPRGLRNMGATCFLNVILQAFLHNPLLRNFFLSDRHNASLCAIGRDCLACEMDKLYAEFFTKPSTQGPYGPTSFLYAIWVDSSSAELSQSGQHDAHEMFISALNGIHSALTSHALERAKLPVAPWDDEHTLEHLYEHAEHLPLQGPDAPRRAMDHSAMCPCVVHRTFGGRLQSSITCLSCKKVTYTREPFFDLSLEVGASSLREMEDTKKKKDTKKKNTPVPDTLSHTLHACLARYCSPEHLAESSYRCSHCQQSAKAIKQLSLLQLPPVLCIQLKRYEHGAGAVKVDTRIRFPHMLDVRECCVASHDENESMDPLAYAYDLLTVVVHEGSLTSGHYTNYSKWRGQWYRFDDDKVTRVSLQQVLEARAYQLFYLRKRLRNNPSHGIDI